MTERRSFFIESLGGAVYIQPMTLADRVLLDASMWKADGKIARSAFLERDCRIVQLCAVDYDGKRLFAADDIERLLHLPAVTVRELSDAAREVSGILDDEAEKLRHEQLKNELTHRRELRWFIRHVAIPAQRFNWRRYLERFSDEEFRTLRALYDIEPWGDEREDYRWRILVNCLAGLGNAELPDEVLHYLKANQPEMTAEESAEAVRSMIRGKPKG